MYKSGVIKSIEYLGEQVVNNAPYAYRYNITFDNDHVEALMSQVKLEREHIGKVMMFKDGRVDCVIGEISDKAIAMREISVAKDHQQELEKYKAALIKITQHRLNHFPTKEKMVESMFNTAKEALGYE